MVSDEILKFSREEKRSLLEIMDKFNIDKSKIETLRRALKKKRVNLKDNRGRKKQVFEDKSIDIKIVKKRIIEIYRISKRVDPSCTYDILLKKIEKLNNLVN